MEATSFEAGSNVRSGCHKRRSKSLIKKDEAAGLACSELPACRKSSWCATNADVYTIHADETTRRVKECMEKLLPTVVVRHVERMLRHGSRIVREKTTGPE